MRMIFKVSYYVRSNYENKQGKSPLMIRIFLNGEMLNVGSSGIYIDKKLWNNSTNRVKGRGSESLNLNAQLDNISNSLQMIFKKHEFDEDLTLDKIKSIFLGKNKVKTTFVEFYDKYLEDIKAQVGAGKSIALYHKYSAARSHFVNFLHAKYGRKDLMPGELPVLRRSILLQGQTRKPNYQYPYRMLMLTELPTSQKSLFCSLCSYV